MKRMFAVAIALSMLAAPAVAAPNNQTYGGQPHNGQTRTRKNQGPQNHGSQQPNPQATKPAPKPQYSYNGRNTMPCAARPGRRPRAMMPTGAGRAARRCPSPFIGIAPM